MPDAGAAVQHPTHDIVLTPQSGTALGLILVNPRGEHDPLASSLESATQARTICGPGDVLL